MIGNTARAVKVKLNTIHNLNLTVKGRKFKTDRGFWTGAIGKNWTLETKM